MHLDYLNLLVVRSIKWICSPFFLSLEPSVFIKVHSFRYFKNPYTGEDKKNHIDKGFQVKAEIYENENLFFVSWSCKCLNDQCY